MSVCNCISFSDLVVFEIKSINHLLRLTEWWFVDNLFANITLEVIDTIQETNTYDLATANARRRAYVTKCDNSKNFNQNSSFVCWDYLTAFRSAIYEGQSEIPWVDLSFVSTMASRIFQLTHFEVPSLISHSNVKQFRNSNRHKSLHKYIQVMRRMVERERERLTSCKRSSE
jgi:hypothetical protein